MKLLSCLLEFLFPSHASEQLVRNASVESFGTHVKPCQRPDRIATLLPYHEPVVRAAIVEAKFRGNAHAQQLLASVLRDYLLALAADRAELEPRPLALVPMPLSKERFRERGYNQCAQIVRLALEGLPHLRLIDTALTRARDTAPQTTLTGEERRKNLIGAFSASRVDPSYAYVVIDDVLTTGTTLQTAMDTLRRAGASDVAGLSLAH